MTTIESGKLVKFRQSQENSAFPAEAAEAIGIQAGWLYLGRAGRVGEGHTPPWFFPSLW